MVQVIENDDPFSRMATSFGKSLSESIPKEAARVRLSQGLKDFQANSMSQTPAEQAVSLFQIPGFTPEMAYTLAPLLKQQQGREGLATRAGQGTSGVPSGAGRPSAEGGISTQSGTPRKPSGGTESVEPTIKPIGSTRSQINPVYVPTAEDVKVRANEILASDPSMNPEVAISLAKDELNTITRSQEADIQAGERQDRIYQNIENELDKTWGKVVGENGVASYKKEIPGTMRQKILNGVAATLADPDNKKSERQLINEAGKFGLAVADTLDQLKTEANNNWYLPGKAEEKVRKINNARQIFKDADSLTEFKDLLISNFGFSNKLASSLTFPVSENKEISKLTDVKDLKKVPMVSGDRKSVANLFSGSPERIFQDSNEKPIEIAKKLPQYLKPSDSLVSIGNRLNERGYNARAFIKEIQRLADQNKISLSDKQRQELNESFDTYPNIQDIWHKSMIGL